MLLAVWDDGVWQDLALLAGIAVGAYLLVMWIAALLWTYRDVQTRTRDPFTQVMSVVLVAVFSLPGLLLYLILRPKNTLAELYDRQLEAEALLHELQEQATCPACRRKIEDDFLSCPYCRAALRVPCDSCGKPLSSSWVLCPYCGADRVAAAPPARPALSVLPPIASPQASETSSMKLRRASTARYTPPAPPAPPATAPDTAPDASS
ncbi:MAG: zinc ribbon domain-containing protein [Chloroflexota bacterium]|nr:zinc ribbon domain-containing protein [Chloroflexota bacterium]